MVNNWKQKNNSTFGSNFLEITDILSNWSVDKTVKILALVTIPESFYSFYENRMPGKNSFFNWYYLIIIINRSQTRSHSSISLPISLFHTLIESCGPTSHVEEKSVESGFFCVPSITRKLDRWPQPQAQAPNEYRMMQGLAAAGFGLPSSPQLITSNLKCNEE